MYLFRSVLKPILISLVHVGSSLRAPWITLLNWIVSSTRRNLLFLNLCSLSCMHRYGMGVEGREGRGGEFVRWGYYFNLLSFLLPPLLSSPSPPSSSPLDGIFQGWSWDTEQGARNTSYGSEHRSSKVNNPNLKNFWKNYFFLFPDFMTVIRKRWVLVVR